ncbi:FtsB family cell division protein [Alicyclobacillus fastidiosus]|uniref:Septum formation initiator family protein n=1 Tax=Alicyclobacillus fastidiosus TaxID=392011 RepID=A0ABV5ADY9_9BACL|nr:septum formation initiator family protein [Alicyclobacillus fastidiosus]WEH09940.1 septum formation initiator family protein [Alicyclobacillus fastidiosus]
MLATRQHGKTTVGPNARTQIRQRHPLFRLRYLALIVICGWSLFHYLHAERPQLVQLQAQHQQYASQLSQLKAENQRLQQEKQQLNSDAYIEKYSAQNFGLTMPGQVPFDLQNDSQHG